MFNTKKKLALALASTVVWSASASAQVDLNATTVTPLNFASELAPSGTPSVLTLTHTGADANITINMSAETEASVRFVRYDLSAGATFNAAPTLVVGNAMAVANANVAESVAEGGAGQSFVIFRIELAAGGAGTPNTVAIGDNLRLGGVVIDTVDSSTAVTLTVATYENQTFASNATTPIGSSVSGSIVGFASGLDTAFTTATLTADVNTNFARFLNVADATYANLGTVNLQPGAVGGVTVLDSDGTNIAVADLTGAVTVTVTGDFGYAAATDGTFTVADADLQLGGANPTSLNATTAVFTLPAGAGNVLRFRTQSAKPGLLTNSEYTAEVNLSQTTATSAGEAVSYADRTGSFGSVSRNGTNVDIPYITTFSDYNQRIILVNRGSTDAPYTVTFTAENGVTATAGSAATGTIAAGETLVVRMTDVVTLNGGTRTAGFISIVAPSGNIDVATTQVNLSDASTDTVVLQ